MSDLLDIVTRIARESMLREYETLASHLAEDAVIEVPGLGQLTGKDEILDYVTSQPVPPLTLPGVTIEQPQADGSAVQITAQLPEIARVRSVCWRYEFDGDRITGLSVSFAGPPA